MLIGSLPEAITNPLCLNLRNNGGLHVLSNFESTHTELTSRCEHFKKFITGAVQQVGLNQVGEAWHNFEGGGFTGVLCLAESHLSIHTWPNENYITFDIFLSNHSCDNSNKARILYQQVLEFFDAVVLQENSVQR